MNMRAWIVVAGAGLLPLVAAGSDGVREINQACASSTGCFPGDDGGFPVTLTDSGSYLLTGDLDVPLDVIAIDLMAEGLTIDLNGFTIRSTYRCEPASCPPIGVGNGINRNFGNVAWGRRVKVINGALEGMSGISVRLAEEAHVEGLVIRHSGGFAIQVGAGSVVLGNRISNGQSRGVTMGEGSVYAHNTVRLVGLGGVSGFDQAISGGTETGGNYCDDSSCSTLRAGPILVASGQRLTCMRWNIGDTTLWINTTAVAGSNSSTGGALVAVGTFGSSSISQAGIIEIGHCTWEFEGDRSKVRAAACVHDFQGPCLAVLQAF